MCCSCIFLFQLFIFGYFVILVSVCVVNIFSLGYFLIGVLGHKAGCAQACKFKSEILSGSEDLYAYDKVSPPFLTVGVQEETELMKRNVALLFIVSFLYIRIELLILIPRIIVSSIIWSKQWLSICC